MTAFRQGWRGAVIVIEHRLDLRQVEQLRRGEGHVDAGYMQFAGILGPCLVVARVSGETSRRYESAAPNGVAVLAMRDYRGPLGLLRQLPDALRSAWIASGSASVVLTPVPGFASLLIWLFARIRRVPYVAHVVGDAAAVPRAIGLAGPGGIGVLLARWIARRQIRSSSAVWYVTEHTLQSSYPYPGLALASSNVELPKGWYRPPPATSNRTPLRVAFVGSLEQPYKGLDILLQAIGKIAGEKGLLELHVVGEGKLRMRMSELATALGLAENVVWHGSVAHDVVRQVLVGSDLFVLPSLTEGMPRALIEAMACGLPCIGSDVGGVPELLPREALVPPGDVEALKEMLDALIDCGPARGSLAWRCYNRSKDFALERLSDQRRIFFESLCRALTADK